MNRQKVLFGGIIIVILLVALGFLFFARDSTLAGQATAQGLNNPSFGFVDSAQIDISPDVFEDVAKEVDAAGVRGDVDLDGQLTVLDLLKIMNHYTQVEPITDTSLRVIADVTCDGSIDKKDYDYLLLSLKRGNPRQVFCPQESGFK